MILDTSVLFDVIVAGPRSTAARHLVTEADHVSAPDLIRIELAGALTRSVRRQEMSIDQARRAYDLSVSIMPEIERSEALVSRAFQLSLELAHPAADCVFLALAERDGTTLATSDARFQRKLAGTPYEGILQLIGA